MTAKAVRDYIGDFLNETLAGACVVSGHWGVGKTFMWDASLRAIAIKGKSAFETYSYVSLFGVDSLEQLKLALFQNSGPLPNGPGASKRKLTTAHIESLIEATWRRIPATFASSGIAKSYIGPDIINGMCFSTIHDQIICFDDLERKGDSLSIENVLGLASFLKEQRNCKVMLLMNEERLGENDKIKLQEYREKVADVSLIYAPTSAESVQIAKESQPSILPRTGELSLKLGVSNIRAIRKIDRALRSIDTILVEFDDEVKRRISHSVALFVWAMQEPGFAPTIEFLKSKSMASLYSEEKGKALTPIEGAWNALLSSYGYQFTDEDDLKLIEMAQSGIFSADGLSLIAKKMRSSVEAEKSEQALRDAWRVFHDSFDNNEKEVVKKINDACIKYLDFMSVSTLSSTVMLFRALGKSKLADGLISKFVKSRKNEVKLFDLNRSVFGENVTDPKIIHEFKKILDSTVIERDVVSILETLSKGWNDDELDYLAGCSPKDFESVFRKSRGVQLDKVIAGALTFSRVTNADLRMKAITENARAALLNIAKGSRLNRRRLKRIGIDTQPQ